MRDMRPYAVLGAGGVGSALAGYLARRGHRVLVAARPGHVQAIGAQGGLRVVSRQESFLVPVEAAPALPPTLPPDTVLCLTVQAHDVEPALETLGDLPRRHPVITWQNGIRAEAAAVARCPRLYGGVVRFTATLLEPGEVRLRGPGTLILGRYPEGTDDLATAVVEDLVAAGFTAAASADIRADKALKLLVNLVSGPPVLLRRTGREPVLAAVQVAILEEALRVLAAAGIAPYPASGLGQPVESLLTHFREGGSAPDTTGGIYNSTWQNLHHRRPRLENDFYHGEIVRLGERFGVPAPVNARALALLEEVRASGAGPEPWDLESFRARFEDVVDLRAVPPAGAGGAEGLEI